jgi:hypothetical protein
MDENQINDGAFGGASNQSKNKHLERGREGSEDQAIDIKSFIRDLIGFTSYIQLEFNEAVLDDKEIREEVERISNMPENVSHDGIEREIKRFIMLLPVAHALKINLLVTIIGTISEIIGANVVTATIDEHNKEQLNERE